MRMALSRIFRSVVVFVVLATIPLTYILLGQHTRLSRDTGTPHNRRIMVNHLPMKSTAQGSKLHVRPSRRDGLPVDPTLAELSETHLVSLKDGNPEFSFRRNDFFVPSKCPTSLQQKLMVNHSWTSELFHPEIKQLLTSTGITRAEYQRLVGYWMPFGFKYHQDFTYEELLAVLRLFPKTDSIFNFTESKPRPQCVSCAVVGNGGILNGSRMGKEIDSHDMVFRVNTCIRRGHEDDVGNRTTHVVLMDRSLVHLKKEDIPRDKGLKYIFLTCRKQDFQYITNAVTSRSPKTKLRVNPVDVRILHPDFVRYVHKMWENTKSFRPTTGGMMFFTALHAGCDTLSVYGMGFTDKYSEHYYDKEYKRFKAVKGSHDFKKEIEILKRLDQDGVIRWYKRGVKEFTQR